MRVLSMLEGELGSEVLSQTGHILDQWEELGVHSLLVLLTIINHNV